MCSTLALANASAIFSAVWLQVKQAVMGRSETILRKNAYTLTFVWQRLVSNTEHRLSGTSWKSGTLAARSRYVLKPAAEAGYQR